MDAILDFFKGISDFLLGIGDSINRTVTGTAQALDMIVNFRANLQGYLEWVPDSVYIVLMIGFSVCLLFIVIGRT